MDYIHNPFPLGDFNPPIIEHSGDFETPVTFPQCDFPGDPHFNPYAPADFSTFPNFYPHPQLVEDYEEYIENLSRPRLTKEQVETLENQFRAHPKPSSNTKKQLAIQTNLTLPRVAVRGVEQMWKNMKSILTFH